MTCIVGIETDSGTLIAGDAAGVAGSALSVRADAKVFRNGEYVIGFTTSFRFGQVLRYGDLPAGGAIEVDVDAEMRFMVTTFVDGVRKLLGESGALTVKDSVDEGGTMLVAWRGRLYVVGGDFQVGRHVDGYYAVGSGASVALGALFATRPNKRMSPSARAQMALRAAVRWCTDVAAPFTEEFSEAIAR